VLANRVEDDSATANKAKGIHDQRIHQMAQDVNKDAQEAKKQNLTGKKQYSKQQLFCEHIFELLPYKQTHEALKNEDLTALQVLLCKFVTDIAIDIWEHTWDHVSDKKEKKNLLKALVYLDALITLYRMPPVFEFQMGDLSHRFRGVKEEALEQIIKKFCTIGLVEQGDRKKGKPQNDDCQYKLMKSKEQIKVLMLHIIGLVVHLQSTQSAKISFLSRILKKEDKELKNYCTELGFRLEPCKSVDKETGKEFDDLIATLRPGAKATKKTDE
jgi:hypothetical protein